MKSFLKLALFAIAVVVFTYLIYILVRDLLIYCGFTYATWWRYAIGIPAVIITYFWQNYIFKRRWPD